MQEELGVGRKSASKKVGLYLPKRSTVLVYCFILVVLLSAHYHIVDGVIEAVLRDEVTGDLLKSEQFLLEMSIHFGYLVTGPLTGLFVVRSGQPKSTIILGFIISSLAVFYTPIDSDSLFSMLWARAMTGAGLGIVIVSLYQFIAIWVPKQEYTRAVTFLTSGYYGGMMFANLWGSVLTKVYSWHAAFYWFSVVSLLFLGFWSYVVAKSPGDHTKITKAELAYLRSNAAPAEGQGLMLKVLLQSRIVWIFFLCNILFQYAHTGIFSVIQFFIVDTLWVDFTFGVLTLVLLYYNCSAMVFDYILKLDRADVTGKNNHKMREAVGAAGSIGCAVFLKLFCGAYHSTGIRLCGFAVALAFLVNAYAGHVSAMLDVIPRHTALIVGFSFIPVGLMNIWAHVGLRWVLDTTGNWSFVLSSISTSLCITGILWGAFGSTERLIS